MSRLGTFGVAILTGLAGMFVSGFIASLAVDWYNIPAREGEAGYFVVAFALLGIGCGVAIGWFAARMARARGRGFLRALGASLGIVVAIGVVTGGTARALADVPPKLDGETMLLAVEVRWPETRTDAPAMMGADEAYVSLHSIPYFSHTVRASARGPLWIEDARRVDGRWIVPGAVEVFTSRGTRMLTVHGEKTVQGFGFHVPLAAFPRSSDLEWSEWLPKFRPGATVPPNMLTYRYRVVKATQPIRTEAIGPFEVATIASGFFEVQHDEHTLNAANAHFAVRYRGKPVIVDVKTSDSTERVERFDNVALLAGPRPAILLNTGAYKGTGHCYVVVENGELPRIEHLTECGVETLGDRLTTDTALFHAAARQKPVRGRIDRVSYAQPGLFHFVGTVLDTRQLIVHRFNTDSTVSNNPYLPPFGFSPDERSFVTYATTIDAPHAPLVVVTDYVANRTYTLPIDPARMRYAKLESLDPAWLNHHFVWQRDRDGVDRLIERRGFVPIPYHGELSVERGGNRTYRLDKGTEALRGALIEFIVKEFGGARQAADSGAYEVPVKIGARIVNVAFSSGSDYVSVSMDRANTDDSSVIASIAERFDAALATGRYDSLFAK